MSETAAQKAGRGLIRTILIILAILLVYAITVQVTDINLEKPLDPARQEGLLRVLRLLADPDLVTIDEDTGKTILSEATRITIERIIETILMALVASTIGTLLAVPISFLAARNLMEDITAPLAAIMAGLVALPLGGLIGLWYSGWLVSLADDLVDSAQFGLPDWLIALIGLAISAILFLVVTRVGSPLLAEKRRSTAEKIILGIRLFLAISLAIISLSFLALLGLIVGDYLREALAVFTFLGIQFFGFIGDFIFVISDVIHLFLPLAVAILAGLIAATFASRYGQEAVLSWPIPSARLLTAILSVFGTAVIAFGLGAFWNWLYEFDSAQNTTLVPSIMGGLTIGVLGMTLVKIRGRWPRLLIGLAISVTASILVLYLSRLVSTMLGFNSVMLWTLIPALISGLVAGVLTTFAPPKQPYNIGFGIYTVVRTILNLLRSIEPLIMGIVFVVWVSLGPFAGIMALTLHSIAALGKLFSEQVEGIDDGPVEAITATGASRLQMVVYAVIPQIIPPFTAFALYRWDINVRMSTIIGFVGGGGIGFVLAQNIQQLRYRQASVMMLAIAIVVAVLDYASAKIRSRII